MAGVYLVKLPWGKFMSAFGANRWCNNDDSVKKVLHVYFWGLLYYIGVLFTTTYKSPVLQATNQFITNVTDKIQRSYIFLNLPWGYLTELQQQIVPDRFPSDHASSG